MRALLIRTTGIHHPRFWERASVNCLECKPFSTRPSASTANHHRLLSSTTPPSKGAVSSVPSSTTTTTPDSDDSYAKDAKVYDSYVSSVQNTARSVQSSLYSYTSGRAQRRREQRARQKRAMRKRRHDEDASSSSEPPIQDTRTISDLLFPNPFKGMNVPEPQPWPSTWAQWKVVFVGGKTICGHGGDFGRILVFSVG